MGTTMESRTTGWMGMLRAGLLALAALGAPAAFAQCAGFSDVIDDGPTGFCPTVEWIKNRNVTTGCTATTYCPSNPVSRLAMAAFMKRLGEALTPVQLVKDLRPGGAVLDNNTVICQTADYTVAGFPRAAYADATVSASATADVSFAADLVISTDAGANWTPLNANPNLGSAPANQYGALSDVGYRELDVGQTVRFGTRLSRGGVAGTTNLSDSRCQTRVLVYSRTGAASPF